MGNSKILEELKKIMPKENWRLQPETSLKNILALEEEYKMNTSDAMYLYDTVNENIFEPDHEKYYLYQWASEVALFDIFNGDKNLINTVK